MKKLTLLLGFMALFSCKAQQDKGSKKKEVQQPNIVWIVTEDISPTFSFYGDKTAKTPNLDALANESMVYDNAFATVGVCAPSRSAIITGMYPTSIGTTHMRAGKDVFSWGNRKYKKDIPIKDINGNPIIQYSTVLPENVKCYTEYMRAAGYFCTNNSKTDYQFAAPITAWDENSQKAHWRNRPENKPFFSVFNIGTTHESRLWKNENLPLTVNPEAVNVPPYLPDNEATRETIARHYSNVELMDAEVGVFIAQLKEDGLYDNTIIFFYSDHGGPLPREKREIYDSGLKVPFMIKDISSKTKGHTDRLMSFVDLAPTMLSLSGVQIPEYIEGKAFLGNQNTTPRNYVYGSSDRFDEFSDRIRSVRDKRFLFLKNDYPELPKYKDVGYRKNVPMMEPFLKLKEEGKLTENQKIWFQTKTKEELYDCVADPYNMHNLIADPKYKLEVKRLRLALQEHVSSAPDLGKLPEAELIQKMWPNFEQPQTVAANITVKNNLVSMKTPTKGASIAYLVLDTPNKKVNYNSHWQLYTQPFTVKKGKYVYAMAERIGYKESEIVIKKIN